MRATPRLTDHDLRPSDDLARRLSFAQWIERKIILPTKAAVVVFSAKIETSRVVEKSAQAEANYVAGVTGVCSREQACGCAIHTIPNSGRHT